MNNLNNAFNTPPSRISNLHQIHEQQQLSQPSLIAQQHISSSLNQQPQSHLSGSNQQIGNLVGSSQNNNRCGSGSPYPLSPDSPLSAPQSSASDFDEVWDDLNRTLGLNDLETNQLNHNSSANNLLTNSSLSQSVPHQSSLGEFNSNLNDSQNSLYSKNIIASTLPSNFK